MPNSIIPSLIEKHQQHLLEAWVAAQPKISASGMVDGAEVTDQCRRFLVELRAATAHGQLGDIRGTEWAGALELLGEVSRARARAGFSPSETARFVFTLKAPLYALLDREIASDAPRLAAEVKTVSLLLDELGLYTTEVYQKSREEVIIRQQEELLELSTPVVELWKGIVAVPLIGTLDSNRTQVVMENLLQQIVALSAEIAIIDITGVPTVDTLVAQHLLKTVSAARLMGADCIISGIRPQIAQTIVHLGVELDVTSKASMSGALELALRRLGQTVVSRRSVKPVE